MTPEAGEGPVLFAYDGSEHAKAAIERAGRELRTGRPALVVTVQQPFETFSTPGAPMSAVPQEVFDRVAERAREIATEGAELAGASGFEAEPLVEAGAPVWERIVKLADAKDAAVVVLGSHGRSGLAELTMGSVATSVAHHIRRPLMITRLPR